MDRPSCSRRPGLVIALCALAVAGLAAREADHRYSTATWQTALGLPDDWHKSMANDRGALLYDFGPGPYAQPLTIVEFTLNDRPLVRSRQWLDAPRVPIVRTWLTQEDTTVEVTTLSVAPTAVADSNGRFARFERLDGISGALGWARPSTDCFPEFRNVAWGTNRAIRYRVRVEPGVRKRVALGFCESYKPRLGERVATLLVEGAPTQTADVALTAPRLAPQVFLFEAGDTDRNGWIDITVEAPPGRDPNTTLALIAVYGADAKLTREDLIGGAGARPDLAELRIACGTEMMAQAPRVDAMEATYPAGANATLTVRTGRHLRVDAAGGLSTGEAPFLHTLPRASRVEQRDDRWIVHFPAGTTRATALVFSGRSTAQEATSMLQSFSFAQATAEVTQAWAQSTVPFGRITVGDPAIQRIIDQSLRTVYQARERINGIGQFNSSFTLYRGLWTGDAVYLIELAAMLGDFARARETLDTIFSFQNERGLIDEMPPLVLFRTTPAAFWALERYAQLSGDWATVKRHWPAVRRGVQALRAARDSTLATPDAVNAGLFPAGFNDGGIAEIAAEYSSVYWTLTGLPPIARAARKLGHGEEAAAIERLAVEFRGAYQRAMTRDLRTDAAGNEYLPVRVGLRTPDPVPQLAQWGITEHLLFGEGLSLESPLALGSIAMLEAAEAQGLTHSTGWMSRGIWAGFGALYGHLPLLQRRPEKAADILYSVANHATPLGTWVEEQSLVDAPAKLAGDQPHCWASALFVRLAASMLACDHADTTHLLLAVPREWLRPGAVNRLDDFRTMGGSLSLGLTVSADGAQATLEISPPREGEHIELHTASLADAGFTLEGTTGRRPGPIAVQPGKPLVFRFTR